MTRTTLKALWFGGGTVLATWIAVSPNPGVPATTPATVRRPASAAEPTAEELKLQTARLRKRSAAVTLSPSTRNPFRYSSPKSSASRAPRERVVNPAAIEPTIQAAPPAPTLKLSGVAQKGSTRTAILSGDGQIYVVGVGDSVAGRYTVVTIDPEAVLLRDTAGVEQRLVLPQ
jgi:Tfp pilus assembly protein PilP